MITSTTWLPPGEGEWRRDLTHIVTPVTRFMSSLSFPAQREGFAEGFRYYGAMLAGFDIALVAGRLYMRPAIAGAPAQKIWGDRPPAKLPTAAGAPPKLVLKMLFKLHPELRRRARRASEVWRDRAWRAMVRHWYDELRPEVIARNRELARTELDALDDTALAAHLEAVVAAFRASFTRHFMHATMGTVVVGDFIARTAAWTGATPPEILGALQGSSPASRAGADAADRVAAAIRAHSDASALTALLATARPAADILAELRAVPGDVGATVRDYIEVHGYRPLSGLDVHHDLVIDMPDLIVRAFQAALDGSTGGAPVATTVIEALRSRTPSAHRAELDDALTEAKLVYGVRDDDVGVVLWTAGLVFRAVREAGRRLAARGAVQDPIHAYDADTDELPGLLRGASAPSADTLRARAEERAGFESVEPPAILGEGGAMPAIDAFPPAVARMQRAVFAFLGAMDGALYASADTPHDTTRLNGTAVSPGIYEGRARVVRSPADFAKIERGDVLVARFTSPAFNVLLPLLGGIVTERGGLLSHAAIVAREYGIPAVVDARNAVTDIPDGARVRVDGDTGTVEIIGPADIRDGVAAPVAQAAPAPVRVTMPAGQGSVVPLRDATGLEFGGKAKALAAALAARLPVPDGIALDADLVARVVAGDRHARDRVRDLLRSVASTVPAPWAVRSSAVGEDSAQASFAGQHATVLGVADDPELAALFDAIASVHASGLTDAARAYRARMAVTGEARMGVVVQALLRPHVSGVMFSRDPSAARREGRLIEATWGLGEALVAGIVTPDRYRVGHDGRILERAIGDKDIAIEARADGGTAEVAIEGDRVRAACLDDAQIAELAQLARRCEDLFGGPQDLEWAVANGRLHLLQSRPVTTSVA